MKTFFCDHISMYILSAVLVSTLFIVSGCCTQRRAVEQNTTVIKQKDSANTEIKVEKEIVYQTDTLYINIPPQTSERTTQDSTSHLENDYATSDARINQDGTLYHDLKTKPQKKPVEFQKPVERRDSIVYRERVRTETVTETVEVPRQLTWFQKTSIYGFWAAIIFLMIVYTIKRLKAHILKIRKK